LYQPDLVELKQTLTSLRQALRQARVNPVAPLGRAELWLIDHSPQALDHAVLNAWRNEERADSAGGLPLHYEHVAANPGFGAGHNRAFEHSRAWAELFLVVNPDLQFVPTSLAAGLDFLAAHQDVGLLAAALIEGDGQLRPACFRHPNPLTLLLRLCGSPRGSAHYECRDWDAQTIRFNPPLVSGCCMLWRSTSYAALGGFDRRYFLYFEDFDLSLRAGRQVRVAYLPALQVRHSGGGAGRKGLKHTLYFARSAWRFFADHGWRGADMQ
jgi:GT2 family glycosyltransferase